MRVVIRRAIDRCACARLLSLGLILVMNDRLAAQVSDASAGAGATLESYSFRSPDKVDVEKISLLTVPITFRALLADRLDLSVNGAYASATLRRRGGQETSIAGLTDTEIRLTYSLNNDRVHLAAVALAPTGKSQLTAGEMDVAGVVAADLLPFAISNWGSGGGIGVNAAVAVPMSDETSFGLSAGYIVAREFEPLSTTSFAYRPGNQLQVRAAADRTIGSAAKASMQLTYLHFGQDQSGGSNLYQAGDRLQAVGSLAFAAGASSTGIVYAGYLRRQQGRYTDVVLVTPSQDLLYAGIGFRHPVSGVVLVPSLDVRVLGNEAGIEQGNSISAGAGVEVPVGELELVPLARARLGRVTVRSGQESGFTGLEIGLSIRNRTFAR
jgi:hypothetical protein